MVASIGIDMNLTHAIIFLVAVYVFVKTVVEEFKIFTIQIRFPL